MARARRFASSVRARLGREKRFGGSPPSRPCARCARSMVRASHTPPPARPPTSRCCGSSANTVSRPNQSRPETSRAPSPRSLSGQVDVGWSVAPFVLDLLSTGAARMIGRASDIAAIREQTIRVQITNASNLAAKKDAIARYMKAYNETVDWMYSSPEAVPRYLAFSGLSEPAVRLMLREFIPKESLQTATISGLEESMKDAVQFKFLPAPLGADQLKELIQIVPAS